MHNRIRYSHKVSQLFFHFLGSYFTWNMAVAAQNGNARYIYSVCDLHDYTFDRASVIHKIAEYELSSSLFNTLVKSGYPIEGHTIKMLVHLSDKAYLTNISGGVLLETARQCSWDINLTCTLEVLLRAESEIIADDINKILKWKSEYSARENLLSNFSEDLKQVVAKFTLKFVNDDSIYGYYNVRAQRFLCECGMASQITRELSEAVLEHSVNVPGGCLKTAQVYINKTDTVAHQDLIAKYSLEAYSKGLTSICKLLIKSVIDKISLVSLAEYAPETELFVYVLQCQKRRYLYTPEEYLSALSAAAEKINFFSIPVLLQFADYTQLTGKQYNLVMCIRDNNRLAHENTILRSEIFKLRSLLSNTK